MSFRFRADIINKQILNFFLKKKRLELNSFFRPIILTDLLNRFSILNAFFSVPSSPFHSVSSLSLCGENRNSSHREMAGQEEYDDLRADIIEQLSLLEDCVETRDKVIASLTSKHEEEIADPEEAKAFASALESLKKDNEDLRRRLRNLREAQEAEDDMAALRQAVLGLTMKEGDVTSRLMYFTFDDTSREGEGSSGGKRMTYARRWFMEKLGVERNQSEEGDATAVLDQLREKVPEIEGNLYFLLSQLFSLIPHDKEQVTRFEEFKSSLEWLMKDSESKIVQGILDLANAFERQVGKFKSPEEKVEKGGIIDSLLGLFLENSQLVAFLVDQSGCTEPEVSLLSDRIEECEAEQKEIQSKIKTLKNEG